MKILDRYILKSFTSTLLTVFAILYFIFILQGVWLFISELAGKDLDIIVIVKFLLFYSPKMVPLVLPLSVLLSSIMTFGNFAEHYEFAAMKASGISLQRAMRPLSIFICGLALISFWFANDVIPKAEYKFINLRREIIHTKPAMAIAAGQFNDMGNTNIKVDKKTGDKGQNLDNVTIHVKSNSGYENEAVIRSTNGILHSSEDSNILQLQLFDGNYYKEVAPKTAKERETRPFLKVNYKIYTMNMDLAQLNQNDGNPETISNTYHMLDVRELNYTIDSLQKVLVNDKVSNTDNLTLRMNNMYIINKDKEEVTTLEVAPDDLLEEFGEKKLQVLNAAKEYISNISFNTENNDAMVLNSIKKLNDHYLALYDKFVIAFSCFLMFYIGAPLGAIIRKGGLGLPMVFAVIIFITYHFINTFGKKVAQEDGMPPFLGAWIGPLILSPLAIFLTYKATRDNGDINFGSAIYPVIDGYQFIKWKIKRYFQASKVKARRRKQK